MTTATTATTYRMPQILRAEASKVASLRSSLWTLLITVGGMVLVTVLATGTDRNKGAQWYQGFDPTNQALAGVLVGMLTVGIFCALTVTGEYASGTIRSSLAAIPRRPRLLAGKIAVAGAATLVVSEVLSFGCFWLGQAILAGGAAPSANLGQPGVVRAVSLAGVCLGLLGLLALGLGVLIRSTAGAISAYVGVTFLLPLILRRIPGDPSRYTPLGLLQNSVTTTVPNHGYPSAGVALLLMAVYACAVVALAAVVFLRRDA